MYYRIFSTVLYRTVNSKRYPLFSYFLVASKLYYLNDFKLCNIFQTCPVTLSAFISGKLYKSGLKFMHLTWDDFRFLDSVDIEVLVVPHFGRWISTLSHFFICLFIGIHKKRKPNHYLLVLSNFPGLKIT